MVIWWVTSELLHQKNSPNQSLDGPDVAYTFSFTIEKIACLEAIFMECFFLERWKKGAQTIHSDFGEHWFIERVRHFRKIER